MNPAIVAVVDRHHAELDELVELQEITQLDRNRISLVLSTNLGLMVEMSDKTWETFQRIVSESRIVWAVIQTERTETDES